MAGRREERREGERKHDGGQEGSERCKGREVDGEITVRKIGRRGEERGGRRGKD